MKDNLLFPVIIVLTLALLMGFTVLLLWLVTHIWWVPWVLLAVVFFAFVMEMMV